MCERACIKHCCIEGAIVAWHRLERKRKRWLLSCWLCAPASLAGCWQPRPATCSAAAPRLAAAGCRGRRPTAATIEAQCRTASAAAPLAGRQPRSLWQEPQLLAPAGLRMPLLPRWWMAARAAQHRRVVRDVDPWVAWLGGLIRALWGALWPVQGVAVSARPLPSCATVAPSYAF